MPTRSASRRRLEPGRPGPRLRARRERAVPYDARGDVTQAQYHFLWPATTINIAPGRRTSRSSAGSRSRPLTLEVTDYWFGEDVDDGLGQGLLAFDAQVANEDTALVHSVQQGLSSGIVQQGRLMLETEPLIHAFQCRVRDALVD